MVKSLTKMLHSRVKHTVPIRCHRCNTIRETLVVYIDIDDKNLIQAIDRLPNFTVEQKLQIKQYLGKLSCGPKWLCDRCEKQFAIL